MKAMNFRDKQIYGNTHDPYFVRFGNLADVKNSAIVYNGETFYQKID